MKVQLTKDIEVTFEIKKAKKIGIGTYIIDAIYTKEIENRPSASNKVRGDFTSAFPGDIFEAKGAFYRTDNGIIFITNYAKRKTHAATKDIVKFLSTNIKGLGKQGAIDIVNYCGMDAISQINENGEKVLVEVGFSAQKAQVVSDQLKSYLRMEESMLYFMTKGLTYSESLEIYSKYNDSSTMQCQSNPYSFIFDLGFDKVEMLANNIGFKKNTIERAGAVLINLMQKDILNGHMYSIKSEIIELFKKEGIDEKMLEEAIRNSLKLGFIAIKEDRLYIKSSMEAEKNIANRVQELLTAPKKAYFMAHHVPLFIEEFEKKHAMELSDEQKEGIKKFSTAPILILTGGPGTGKTQVSRAFIDFAKSKGYSISLACPTGKASARLSEVVGEASLTIHRRLGIGFGSLKAKYDITEDIVLIDEMSMVGVDLFYSLLSRIDPSSRVVFVGDIDQIPSVEAGDVLNSMIESGKVEVVRLKKVFRQAEGSKIIENIHKIKNNDLNLEYANDFRFKEMHSDSDTMSQIMKIYDYLINVEHKSIYNIAVLSPSKETALGTKEMNFQIQRHFNKNKEYMMSSNGVKFIKGDKVMQTVNDAEREIYNGTTGVITNILDGMCVISFDVGSGQERIVHYNVDDITENVIHAYSSTIHKYQGSEIDTVIVPLSHADDRMWNKKLFYTGLSRAKKMFIMVGNKDVFTDSCMKDATTRRTGLKEELEKYVV